MTDSPVYCLDLGSSKIACVALGFGLSGEVEILEAASAPCKGVRKGIITDLDEVARSLDHVVRRIRQTGNMHDVHVAVGGSSLDSVNAQGFTQILPSGRPITRGDVLAVMNHSRQVLPEPDREQIFASPREFRVDGTRGVQKPVGLSANRLEVTSHLVTAPMSQIQNIERVLSRVDLRIRELVPTPIASAAAVLRPEDKVNGVVLVDIGAGTTSVVVYAQGAIVFTSVLPVGGHSVTSDLATLLQMLPEDAEALKLKHGRALVGAKHDESTVEIRRIGASTPKHLLKVVLHELIESRMKEIATMVRQRVEKSGQLGLVGSGVVLTGGGALLPAAPALFGQILGETHVRQVAHRLEGPAAIRANGPEWSASVGLGLMALQPDEDAVEPATGFESWKERIRSLFQLKV